MIDEAHLIAEITEEILARQRQFRVESFCFAEQIAFISDPARYKTAVCSRRSGKTIASAVYLTHTARSRPGTVSLYITLSRSNAKRIVWPDLLKINREYDLGGSANETELSLKFPNGSIIYLSGAKDKTEIESFGAFLWLLLLWMSRRHSEAIYKSW